MPTLTELHKRIDIGGAVGGAVDTAAQAGGGAVATAAGAGGGAVATAASAGGGAVATGASAVGNAPGDITGKVGEQVGNNLADEAQKQMMKYIEQYKPMIIGCLCVIVGLFALCILGSVWGCYRRHRRNKERDFYYRDDRDQEERPRDRQSASYERRKSRTEGDGEDRY